MTLAVLCARNQRNAGMYSVDLAACQYFSEAATDFRLCRTQGATRWGALDYFKAREWREFDSFNQIVYWGDWQTNPRFGHLDYVAAEAKHQLNYSQTDALRRWQDCYQLTAMDEHDNRPVITIGTSFIGLDKATMDRASWAAFENYIGRSAAIVPRDPNSYATLNRHFPSAKNIYSDGIDPAFLMSWQGAAPRDPAPDCFCFCFGRSLRRHGSNIRAALQVQTGLPAVFVDWNKSRFPRRLNQRTFGATIELLRNCRFCATDIYHLAVNALNLGVPTICFGAEDDDDDVVMGEPKKRTLFSSFELQDFYIPFQEDPAAAAELAYSRILDPDCADRFSSFGQLLSERKRRFRELIGDVLHTRPG